MPSRTPRLTSRSLAATAAATSRERLVDARGVGAAALRDVGLAAALAAEQRADRAHQVAGARARAAWAASLSAATTDTLPSATPTITTTPGVALRQPAADVEREGAHVAAARAVDAVRHDPDAADVLRAGGELGAAGEQLLHPDLLDLLLGHPQPVDEVGRPGRPGRRAGS